MWDLKHDTNERVYKTDSQTQKKKKPKPMVTKREGGGRNKLGV